MEEVAGLAELRERAEDSLVLSDAQRHNLIPVEIIGALDLSCGSRLRGRGEQRVDQPLCVTGRHRYRLRAYAYLELDALLHHQGPSLSEIGSGEKKCDTGRYPDSCTATFSPQAGVDLMTYDLCCVVCDREFEAKRKDAKHCRDPECVREWARRRQERSRWSRLPRPIYESKRPPRPLDIDRTEKSWRSVDGRRWRTVRDQRDYAFDFVGRIMLAILHGLPPDDERMQAAFDRFLGDVPQRSSRDETLREFGRKYAKARIDARRALDAIFEQVRRDMLEEAREMERTLDNTLAVEVGKLEARADKRVFEAHADRDQVAKVAALLRRRYGVGSEEARALEEQYAMPPTK